MVLNSTHKLLSQDNHITLIYKEQLDCAAGQQVSKAAAVGEAAVPRRTKDHSWQHRDSAVGHQHAVSSAGQPYLHAIAVYSYATGCSYIGLQGSRSCRRSYRSYNAGNGIPHFLIRGLISLIQ